MITNEQYPIRKVLSNGCEIIAFPSIHYHAEFAVRVHQYYSQEKQPAEITAVELGPAITEYTCAELRSLLQMQDAEKGLPLNLAVQIRNAFIHPDNAEKVYALQKVYNCTLNDLPGTVLSDLHPPIAVLPLFCSDSIFEAVRSSIELNIPIVGIDLNNVPPSIRDSDYPIEMFWDAVQPIAFQNALTRGIDTDADIVDTIREQVMAHRLLQLSKTYRKIVFIHGLAHWKNISKYLDDAAELPLPEGFDAPSEYMRPELLKLDPSIVVNLVQTISYPQMVVEYENARTSAADKNTPDFSKSLNNNEYGVQLLHSCREEFIKDTGKPQDWLRFMRNLEKELYAEMCAQPRLVDMLIASFDIPDLHNIILKQAAANDKWANNKTHQWMDTLYPSVESTQRLSVMNAKDTLPESIDLDDETLVSDYFALVNEMVSEDAEPFVRHQGGEFWVYNEVPIYMLASQANRYVFEMQEKPVPMQQGLNGKTDIVRTCFSRSVKPIEQVYIKPKKSAEAEDIYYGYVSEPTVILFNQHTKNSTVQFYSAGGDVHKYVKNKSKFQRYTANKGCYFIASVQICEDFDSPPVLRKYADKGSLIHSALLYGDPILNKVAGAAAIEDDYDAYPLVYHRDAVGLIEYCDKKGIDIRHNDNTQFLLMAGVAQAKRSMTILTNEVKPSAEVLKLANRLKITLHILPLKMFYHKDLRLIREKWSFRTLSSDALSFPKELETILKMRQTDGIEQLPAAYQQRILHSFRNRS